MVIRSFGQQIRHFARSTDILQESEFQTLLQMLKEYVAESFEMHKVELLLETAIGGAQGLRPQWDREDRYGAYLVRDPERNGEPQGANALAFLAETPLWIVAQTPGPLVDAETYVDLWSNSQEIPPFRRFTRVAAKQYHSNDRTETLVSIPLCNDGRAYGVLYFESPERLQPTERTQNELKRLAEAYSLLHLLARRDKDRQSNTSAAIGDLREALSDAKMDFQMSKPSLFFAYPSNTDTEVISTIKTVIDNEFAEIVQIVDWREISKSGEITQHLLESIQQAKYAVCLFSEQIDESKEPKFRDNPNVLFEAGMMHALVNDKSTIQKDWIPVREQPPPELPFDFQNHRVLVIERFSDGRLNVDNLKSSLNQRLTTILDGE